MGAVPLVPPPQVSSKTSGLDTHSPAIQHHGHLGRLVHIASKGSAGSASQTTIAEPCCPESWGRREPHRHQNNKEERQLCVPPLPQHALAHRPPSCPLSQPDSQQVTEGLCSLPRVTHPGGGEESAESRLQLLRQTGRASPSPPAGPRGQGHALYSQVPCTKDLTTACHSWPVQHHTVNTAHCVPTQRQGRAWTKAHDRGCLTGKAGHRGAWTRRGGSC